MTTPKAVVSDTSQIRSELLLSLERKPEGSSPRDSEKQRFGAFDRQRIPGPKPSGQDSLRHLLDEHGLNAADLSRLLGAHRTLGAMILRGERKLTLDHVRVLSNHFRVSPEAFL